MNDLKKANNISRPKEASSNSAPLPPVHLPIDPAKFWSRDEKTEEWTPPVLDTAPALKRLGPLPFSRSGFPLMGFLATVYEHVTTHVQPNPNEAISPPNSKIEDQSKPE